MDRDKFLLEMNSPENLKSRAEAVKIVTGLISAQTDLRIVFNREKKQRLKDKYIETKKRLSENERVFKRYG